MRIIAVFFILTSLLTSCSEKYDEGPQLTFRSAQQRIEGSWKWAIARRTEEGREVNQSLLVANDTLQFLADGTARDTRYGLEGEWSLISKNTELNLIFGPAADSLRIPSAIAFQIKRLLKREVWLEFADDSVQIEWQLRSVEE